MKRLFTTLTILAAMVLSLAGIETKAQTVTDINVEAYGNNVIVKYNLDKATDIDLYVSVDGGVTWEGPLKQVTGNVGKNVQPGSNVIMWDAIKERGGISGDDIRFDIRLPKMTATTTTYTQKDNDSGLISIKKSTKTGEQYVIEYKLKERAPFVGLYYSEDNGKTWKQAKEVDGDMYNVWPSEKRQLTWNYTEETSSSITPTFKLKIMQNGSIDKAYKKDLDKKHFAEKNSSAYYYDNGKIIRKYYEGWFVQPEIGVGLFPEYGFDNDIVVEMKNFSDVVGLTINCLVGYQIVRPFGVGLKIGYMNDVLYEYSCSNMPITINFRGFLGKKQTCMYYSVGIGYLANLMGIQSDLSDSYYRYSRYSSGTYCKGFVKAEKSGLLLSAEIGLAIKNFNIGVEYNYTKAHYKHELDLYEYKGYPSYEYSFIKHDSYSEKCGCHIVILKFGYNIPLGKKK